MLLEMWDIARVTPYAKNARKHSAEQIGQLAASSAAFGFVNPCLVDAEGRLLAGHGRLQAAHTLGLAQVPVLVISGLSAAQKRAYTQADNRLALNATWDAVLLAAEVIALNAEQVDPTLLGFSEAEIANLLGTLATGTDDADADDRQQASAPRYDVLVHLSDEPQQAAFFAEMKSREIPAELRE